MPQWHQSRRNESGWGLHSCTGENKRSALRSASSVAGMPLQTKTSMRSNQMSGADSEFSREQLLPQLSGIDKIGVCPPSNLGLAIDR
jgi:hypothetical protein